MGYLDYSYKFLWNKLSRYIFEIFDVIKVDSYLYIEFKISYKNILKINWNSSPINKTKIHFKIKDSGTLKRWVWDSSHSSSIASVSTLYWQLYMGCFMPTVKLWIFILSFLLNSSVISTPSEESSSKVILLLVLFLF